MQLTGTVGGWDFDSEYVDYILNKKKDKEVCVMIDSLGGLTNTGLSIAGAFRNHGNVSVVFRGMNASAATIAALGAKKVSMDENGLYLIHKCSALVVKWAYMNEEQLADAIKDLDHTRQNNMKVDLAVAKSYASRTGKTCDEMLDLMSKELWLTADEAKEYGFIDEVIKAEKKQSDVVLTSSMEDRFKEAGIPIPSMLHKQDEENFFTRLKNFFKTQNSMEQNQNQEVVETQSAATAPEANVAELQQSVSDLNAQVTSLQEENQSLRDENARLTSDIAAMQSKTEEPQQVMHNDSHSDTEDDASDFLSNLAKAKELSNLV